MMESIIRKAEPKSPEILQPHLAVLRRNGYIEASNGRFRVRWREADNTGIVRHRCLSIPNPRDQHQASILLTYFKAERDRKARERKEAAIAKRTKYLKYRRTVNNLRQITLSRVQGSRRRREQVARMFRAADRKGPAALYRFLEISDLICMKPLSDKH